MKIKNKNTKAALGEIVYCGSQLKVAVHHHVEVTEEDYEEAAHIASSQEAETDKFWCSAALSFHIVQDSSPDSPLPPPECSVLRTPVTIPTGKPLPVALPLSAVQNDACSVSRRAGYHLKEDVSP